MERHDDPYGRTVYMVDWKHDDDSTVWRANFLTYESYLDFVSKDSIVVVKEAYRVV